MKGTTLQNSISGKILSWCLIKTYWCTMFFFWDKLKLSREEMWKFAYFGLLVSTGKLWILSLLLSWTRLGYRNQLVIGLFWDFISKERWKWRKLYMLNWQAWLGALIWKYEAIIRFESHKRREGMWLGSKEGK